MKIKFFPCNFIVIFDNWHVKNRNRDFYNFG